MKRTRITHSLLILLILCYSIVSKAQYGYSPYVDSLMNQVTDSALSLNIRQLCGDTTVIIGGVTDSIKTRHSNFADNSKAAQFILEKFQSFGLNARIQQYDDNGQNVIATLEGTLHPEQQYIICGHYDDMPNGDLAPGADDNASGSSAVLEAARILSQHTFPCTIKFITFDEEEQLLIGSQYYADSAYLMGHQILGVLNLDMIAWDSNNDFEFSISSNTASMPMMADFVDLLRIYQPVLSAQLITIGSSDHLRFWNKGYSALLAIEEYQADFNTYYHSVNDKYEFVNHDYAVAITRGAVASLVSWVLNYKMDLAHEPLENFMFESERMASLTITAPFPIDTGENSPRLYYKVDDGDFNYLNASFINGDTFNFMLPGFLQGSKISYYFAAQDAGGNYTVTLPEYGKGVNPPGTIAPPASYSYYVLDDTVTTVCASGLPLSIPANQTVMKSLPVPFNGRILDINVQVSVSHTMIRDINLSLISPSGREVMLSTRNGYNMDNYTNCVFDDEALLCINQVLPPYTGSFRPEKRLRAFEDTVSQGLWQLKVRNAGSFAGSLTNFCITFRYSVDYHYVDGSLPVSGDGQSWETALTSISEAIAMDPLPGSVVLIKPGTYQDELMIATNGEEVVSLTTGVIVEDSNKIRFPAGTDLSAIDTESFPGQYYAYVFRSRMSNNGFYQVIESDDLNDYVRVTGKEFAVESGTTGDSTFLSAAIGRPVIYRKYSDDPENERIIIDAGENQLINSAVYVGDTIGDGNWNANPANYNLIDGIDFTDSPNGEGVHIQNPSFNVVCNSRIYTTGGTGIYINGNGTHPAYYNIIAGNEIYNTPLKGMQIGNDSMPQYNNNAHYTHLLDNIIHTTEEGSLIMDNAIDIEDYNSGTVVEGNCIHNIDLEEPDQGVLHIHSHANHTLVNGNIFRNIGKVNTGTDAIIMVDGSSHATEIYNNIIFDSLATEDEIYAFHVNGTGHDSSFFAHNTIYNIDRAFLLEDNGDVDFGIYNNILMVNDACFTHLGNEGNFDLSNNLYFSDPVPENWMPYFSEYGRQIGVVGFVCAAAGNFRVSVSGDLAICNGKPMAPAVTSDPDGTVRSEDMPDIGAFELPGKAIWSGISNSDWDNELNWAGDLIPGPSSNAIIFPSSHDPVINNEVLLRGILLKPGASLNIIGAPLNILQQ